jgi:hypothetical protein
MSALLQHSPFGPRDESAFLAEMNALTAGHLSQSPELRCIWREWRPAQSVAEIPFLHVGLFKSLDFRKTASGKTFGRVLESSSTTGSRPSRIPLDAESSALQSRSVTAILRDFIGAGAERTLLIVDCSRSLRSAGTLSARTAAAMSLSPLAGNLYFLLEAPDTESISWQALSRALAGGGDLLVYGFTWALWQAWRTVLANDAYRDMLADRKIIFLHSGGWKKMESARVDRSRFDDVLTASAGPGSKVIDFYGLVEQVGIVYPLCNYGARHVPVWADALVRNPWTMEPVEDEPGQLALMNTLARGAPYQSILTEDLARILPGPCGCGRSGRRFELLGRIPKAETRGCSNV